MPGFHGIEKDFLRQMLYRYGIDDQPMPIPQGPMGPHPAFFADGRARNQVFIPGYDSAGFELLNLK
jgi:hypothetical protein|tara:strand:+ start:845 stop:1042 length:198 start_codon:yes stop_codon:yes gene_type:complete